MAIQTEVQGGVFLQPVGEDEAGIKRFSIIGAGSVFTWFIDIPVKVQEELAREFAMTNDELRNKLKADQVKARLAIDAQPNGGQPVQIPPGLFPGMSPPQG